MAKWRNHLDISDIWGNDNLSAEEKGKLIAIRLKEQFAKFLDAFMADTYDQELDNIVQRFEDITGYEAKHKYIEAVDEFDEVMDLLYDWGDLDIIPGTWPPHKNCWIKVR